MRTNFTSGYFRDLGSHTFHHPPNVVIKDEDVDYSRIIETADQFALNPGLRRYIRFITNYTTPAFREFEMVPFRMPTGAADLTLGAVTYAGNVATYTPTLQGRLLLRTGALAGASAAVEDIAGMLLDDYFLSSEDNISQMEKSRVTTLEEGDFLWLIKSGDVDFDTDEAVNANDILHIGAGGVGKVGTTAINTGGSIADYHSSLLLNLLGAANPRAQGVGIAQATVAAPGLVRGNLLLPDFYGR